MDKSELIVGGYYFGSFEDAKAAEKEIKNAGYLNERIATMGPAQMKAVYDKMLDEKVFQTPVGWEFLKYLKNRLKDAGVSEEDIRPIPLYCNFNAQKQDKLDKEKNNHIARERVIPSRKQAKTFKDMFRVSLVINIALVLLVVLMFFITIKSNNPNILNYKEVITNEYAAWEQELTERENALREKENNL